MLHSCAPRTPPPPLPPLPPPPHLPLISPHHSSSLRYPDTAVQDASAVAWRATIKSTKMYQVSKGKKEKKKWLQLWGHFYPWDSKHLRGIKTGESESEDSEDEDEDEDEDGSSSSD